MIIRPRFRHIILITFKFEAAVKLYKRVCHLCLHFFPSFPQLFIHFSFLLPPLSVFFSFSPPPPASKGDSCLSLINAWHLAQRGEGRDAGEERGGTRGGEGGLGAAHRSRRREVKKAAGIKEQGFFGSGHCARRGEGGERDDEV